MNEPTPISADEAIELMDCEGADFYALMARAGILRERFKGNEVFLCGILNAKSGRCSEDCAFCAQSARFATGAPEHPLVEADKMVQSAEEAIDMGAGMFSLVTSGNTIRHEREIEEISIAIEEVARRGRVGCCASLGNLSEGQLAYLKRAGLTTYHHNLETSRSFFPEVCTTHDYDLDVGTVRMALGLGLRVCCGGVFGLGESAAQRIELAVTVRDLGVHSVPLNFLDPIVGTPLEAQRDLTPVDCLRIIAVFRLMMPDRDILVCGGRERNLRDMQSWIFLAGANGMMIGDYLTTSGRDHVQDLRMINDLGLTTMDYGDTK